MAVAVDFCFRPGEAPPLWTFFVALFVAVAAGFLWGRRSWRRIKTDRGFSLPQFTLRGLLAVITASAVLLGLLQWFGAAPGQWGAVIVFFGIVWVAQRFLFRRRRPWLASLLVGAALGLFLWFCAWTAAEDHAAWLGKEVPTAELVRDLFLAVGMGVALAVAANLLLAWSLWVVAFLGILFSRPTSREGRQPIPPDSQPETAEELPAGAGGAGEGEPRRDDSGEPRRAAILHAAGAVLLLACAAILQKPIRIWYYRHAAEYYFQQACDHEGPSPLEGFLLLFRDMSYSMDGSGSYELYEECRDKLVDLGYFTHRVFVFEHIQTGPQDVEDSEVFRLAMKRFSDNIHTLGSWSEKPEPFRLDVWDRPGKIPEWEVFVREVDRPDFPENVAP